MCPTEGDPLEARGRFPRAEGGTLNVTTQPYTACLGQGGTAIAGTQHTFNSNPDNVAVELVGASALLTGFSLDYRTG